MSSKQSNTYRIAFVSIVNFSKFNNIISSQRCSGPQFHGPDQTVIEFSGRSRPINQYLLMDRCQKKIWG